MWLATTLWSFKFIVPSFLAIAAAALYICIVVYVSFTCGGMIVRAMRSVVCRSWLPVVVKPDKESLECWGPRDTWFLLV